MTCNHQWKYHISHVGCMDYGGPIVRSEHREERCELCGKIRMKVQRFSPWYIVRSRKENVIHRQIPLL
jgi:hypothetical protein